MVNKRKGERDKHQSAASLTPLNGDLASNPGNPGMCPDWELNQQPFNPQAGTQPTKLH